MYLQIVFLEIEIVSFPCDHLNKSETLYTNLEEIHTPYISSTID